MASYNKLYTPADSGMAFIDNQPPMLFGVASMDRATLSITSRCSPRWPKNFKVPTVLSAVEAESFTGYIWPQLLDVFPGRPVVERSSMIL